MTKGPEAKEKLVITKEARNGLACWIPKFNNKIIGEI